MNKALLLACFACLASDAAGDATPLEVRVAATIKPLQLIAQAIVAPPDAGRERDEGRDETRDEVQAIIDPHLSPHHYNLSPSDRLALEQADLILWIGGGFEASLSDFMTRKAAAQAASTETVPEAAPQAPPQVITAATLPGIHLLPPDYHLWLDTRNAATIAAAVAEALSRRHPTQREYFHRNLQSFRDALTDLEQEVARLLAPAATLSYAPDYDSLRYFENQHGLPHAPPLLRDPERQPTIREVQQARAALNRHQPTCIIIAEPDTSPRLLATLLGNLLGTHRPRQAPIDLLGSNTENYPTLIRNIAHQITSCRK